MKIKKYRNRKKILCNRRQLREVVDDMWEGIHLVNKEKNILYRRGDILIYVLDENQKKVAKAMSNNQVYSMIISIADFVKLTKDNEEYDVFPDAKIAADIVTSPDDELPELDAILNSPFLSRDGKIIFERGYHKEHKIYLDMHDLQIPELPNVVSDEDVARAKDVLLNEFFGDFPFVNSSDQAHALAALIQQFIRPNISGCTPLYLAMAPSPGTGKTLLVNAISTVITGSPVPAQAIPNDEDEMRKRLTSVLATAPSVFFFDNADINSKINSASLSLALTSEKVSDRALGYNRVITVPNNCLWIMTANNPQTTNEVARRALCIRLDAKCERPHERSNYKHPDLVQWATENRGRLIHAILVLIKNWIDKGAVDFNGQPLASFVDCTKKIGGILQAAGVEGFLEGQGDFYSAADTESKDLEYLSVAWFERYKDTPIKVSQVVDLCHQCEVFGDVIGFGNTRSQQTRLGNFLLQLKDRVIGEKSIKLIRGGRTHGKLYALVPLNDSWNAQQMMLAPTSEFHQETSDDLDNHDNPNIALNGQRSGGIWN